MAWFLVAVGLTPSEYRKLTIRERAAIRSTYRKAHNG